MASFRASTEYWKSLVHDEPANFWVRADLASSYLQRADFLIFENLAKEAMETLRPARELLEPLVRDNPRVSSLRVCSRPGRLCDRIGGSSAWAARTKPFDRTGGDSKNWARWRVRTLPKSITSHRVWPESTCPWANFTGASATWPRPAIPCGPH